MMWVWCGLNRQSVVGGLQHGADVELRAALREKLVDKREQRGRRYVHADRERVFEILQRDDTQTQRCGRIDLQYAFHFEFVAIRGRDLAVVQRLEHGFPSW